MLGSKLGSKLAFQNVYQSRVRGSQPQLPLRPLTKRPRTASSREDDGVAHATRDRSRRVIGQILGDHHSHGLWSGWVGGWVGRWVGRWSDGQVGDCVCVHT